MITQGIPIPKAIASETLVLLFCVYAISGEIIVWLVSSLFVELFGFWFGLAFGFMRSIFFTAIKDMPATDWADVNWVFTLS